MFGPCWAFSADAKRLNATQSMQKDSQVQKQSLKPMTSGLEEEEWEYILAILDSGASVIVIPPHVGKGYDIVPGDSSKAGIMKLPMARRYPLSERS